MDKSVQFINDLGSQSSFYIQMGVFFGTIVFAVVIAVVLGNILTKTFWSPKKEIREILSTENNESYQKDIEVLVRSFEGKHTLFVEATIDEQNKSILATREKLNKLSTEISKADIAVRFMRKNDDGYEQKNAMLEKLKADESKLQVFHKKQYEAMDAMKDAQEKCIMYDLLIKAPALETFIKAVSKGGAKHLEELKQCDLPEHEVEKIKSFVKQKYPQS
jgi:hypothetical protein